MTTPQMSSRNPEPLHPETLVVSTGRPAHAPGAPVTTPVSLSSTFVAGGTVHYAREGNETWTAFESAVGALEGGTALAFSSGLAVLAAVLDGLGRDAVVVAPGDSYTGTRFLLGHVEERGRLAVRLVDIADTEATVKACEGASLLVIESPTNPLLAVADIPALVAGAHEAGTTVLVDNTFATPLVQRPLDLGADVVMHSATKLLAGHSDVVMGVVVTRDVRRLEQLYQARLLGGAIPGPFEAYLALRGVRTLAVRAERASANAGALAERLRSHPTVSRVRYPGFGSIVSFECGGDATLTQAACESVRLITHATSLGGVETTMERRRRHPGEDLVPDDLVRMSVGIEHVDDLWADLSAALDRAMAQGER